MTNWLFDWFSRGGAGDPRREADAGTGETHHEPGEPRDAWNADPKKEETAVPEDEDAGEPQEDDEEVDAEEESVYEGSHPRSLPPEFHYLEALIRYRIERVLHPHAHAEEPVMPPCHDWQLPIGRFILDYNRANTPLTANEARLLLIALVDHVQSDLFDHAINRVLKGEGDFPMIGGARGKNFRGFIPTGQTAVFLLAGDDWERELVAQQLFWGDHVFAKNKILWLGDVEPGEPVLSGKIILSQDYVDTLVHDKEIAPHHNVNFPAKLISTTRVRSELVVSDQLNNDFEHLLDWIRHKKTVEKKMVDGKKGYRCLFHGPSGTGKTFATCILGKETGKQVYRVDLSLVVSKFIGETEKNLELVFARAENKDWILFFDEADALFGKRTNIRDAHDKYANQEVSYLLQRIEEYDGLVILATNMKNNIDDAFLRRFDSDLKFSMPNVEERKKIWQNSFPSETEFRREDQRAEPEQTTEPERRFYRYDRWKGVEAAAALSADLPLNIPELVKGYGLTGANIQNVVRYASIRAAKRHEGQEEHKEQPLVIYLDDVKDGINRELSKNGIPLHHKHNRKWDNQQPV
jgi:ATPase family protein associated with various cellular activities (AAA)